MKYLLKRYVLRAWLTARERERERERESNTRGRLEECFHSCVADVVQQISILGLWKGRIRMRRIAHANSMSLARTWCN